MNRTHLLPPPPTWSERMYLRIPRREIAFFKFMLEAEHNLALMTVVDKYEAAIKLSCAPGQRQEVEDFLDRLQDEIALERLSVPRAA
ncbi:MAG: DUF4911 domain-containing protein [Desulfovermiculus sp.]|nr:DUF4911 domain-containing protein [Desulfovermiculus sp.]